MRTEERDVKILLADDEKSIRKLIEHTVSKLGHEPISAENGEQALSLYDSTHPDLVILDIMMPHIDGFEICERIKAKQADIPVLFLSAKGDIVDKRIGFKTGGDDYLTKPFDPEELKLRIEALLRRAAYARNESRTDPTEALKIGPFEFDDLRLTVFTDDRDRLLTPKEYQILHLLASNRGVVFSAESLIDQIWGSGYRDGSINIPAYIRRIRQKVEKNPSKPTYVKTVWGSGYYFVP